MCCIGLRLSTLTGMGLTAPGNPMNVFAGSGTTCTAEVEQEDPCNNYSNSFTPPTASSLKFTRSFQATAHTEA